jgi:hypothetical protein
LREQVNGQQRQRGSTADMMFRIPQLLYHVSQVVTLEPGDLICTGARLLLLVTLSSCCMRLLLRLEPLCAWLVCVPWCAFHFLPQFLPTFSIYPLYSV